MAQNKKKVSIQARRRLFFSRPICFFLVAFVAIALIYNIVEVYQLTNEKKQKEEEYVQLQEESEYLKNELEKLSDPEYLANFARENYSYSKEGELIIKIDDSQEEKEKIETDVKEKDSNSFLYISIACGLIITFIFINSIRQKKYSDK